MGSDLLDVDRHCDVLEGLHPSTAIQVKKYDVVLPQIALLMTRMSDEFGKPLDDTKIIQDF